VDISAHRGTGGVRSCKERVVIVHYPTGDGFPWHRVHSEYTFDDTSIFVHDDDFFAYDQAT
jgi:hypothetical protein